MADNEGVPTATGSLVSHTPPARIAKIGQYRVLTEPPRRDLTALAEIAAMVAGVPKASVNLITDTEQHSIATAGFDPGVCARTDSMCHVVFEDPSLTVVPDATRDPRFVDHPFVNGDLGAIRFYASHPLVTPTGEHIGTLCVFDDLPRVLTAEQSRALVGLAERVVDLLELELRTRELSQTVEDLQRARDELARSNETLTAFAGQVGHDLRSPLAAVSMGLDLLAENATDEESEFLLIRATGGAQRMQLLIDDLLAYAKVGGELVRVSVDLNEVVEEAVDDLAVALQGATVEVGPLPTVVGDRVQLRAVVQNLLANAAKFTHPGRAPRVWLNASRTATGWRIEVRDDGLGVPPEDRGRLFQPLARIDESVEGSGIGLATCRRILEAHGGMIRLDANPGGGTCAWFELPAP